MKEEERFKCDACGADLFHVERESLLRGDKPTAAECARCGFTISV